MVVTPPSNCNTNKDTPDLDHETLERMVNSLQNTDNVMKIVDGRLKILSHDGLEVGQ